jgi:23S rRNA (guanine745-N1)-methyltransferase
MDVTVVACLRCPSCAQSLQPGQHSLACPNGHSFDLARQGYVDLSGARVTNQGDTAEMIAARAELIGAGHLRTVTDALTAAVGAIAPGPDAPSGGPDTTGTGPDTMGTGADTMGTGAVRHRLVVDVGAGTGQHLAAVLDARPDLVGLAVDVSKAALRRAARAHPRLAAVRADVWRGLPVLDDAADVVLDVFAPRSAAEFHRILRPDGILVVVTPEPEHLVELVSALGLLAVDPDKRRRLSEGLSPYFEPETQTAHAATLRLSRAEALTMVRMGPSAWHTEPQALVPRLAELPEPITATLSIRVGVWLPRPRNAHPQGHPR